MNQMRTRVLALVLLLAPVISYSANFDVTPIRLWLESESQVQSLSIRNSGGNSILVQAELMRWKGGSKMAPSRDLLVNPPIFKLDPQKTQIVRVALAPGVKHSADHSQGNEVAYRLYLREIPRTVKRGDPLLQTALRIGIPIFIPPEIKTRDVRWEAIEASPGEIQVKARNSGTVHVRLVHLEVREGTLKPALQRDLREYLFPGQSKTWALPWSGGSRVALSALTDEGTLSAELAVKKK